MIAFMLIVVAIALGGLRIAGVTSPLFQGVAHIFVGGCFGAYFAGRDRLQLLIAVGLTILEVACFIAGKL